jgi:predicted Zn-dependent protease
MYAAPIALLAAGGANTLIVLDSVTLEVNYGAAQFAAGGVIAAQYDSTVHGAGVAASGTIAAATAQGWAADSVVAMQGLLGSATAAATVNKGIYLSNATGAFTTGDSTLVAHIRYAVLPTTF